MDNNFSTMLLRKLRRSVEGIVGTKKRRFSVKHIILLAMVFVVVISAACFAADKDLSTTLLHGFVEVEKSPLEMDISLSRLKGGYLPTEVSLQLKPISQIAGVSFLESLCGWKLFNEDLFLSIDNRWPDSIGYKSPSEGLSDLASEQTVSKLGPLLKMMLAENSTTLLRNSLLRRSVEEIVEAKKSRKTKRPSEDRVDIAGFSDLVALYADGILVSKPSFSVSELGWATGGLSTPISQKLNPNQVGVFIQTKNGGADLRGSGLDIVTVAGDIVTAKVTLDELLQIAERENVAYIEAAYRLAPELDKSIPAVGADLLHNVAPTVLGSGITIGVVDTGIDWQHPDFREDSNGDGFEESSKLEFIWDQTDDFGSPPSNFHYGTEYTNDQIESDIKSGDGPGSGLVREKDTSGHGTHVAGIAVSDGSSSGLDLTGMAPQADIIAVKSTFYSTEVIDGINYILEKSAKLGKPAVVNLSLGGHLGPHDGTSLFEQAIDQALEGKAGAIVTSAGNGGNDKIHIGDVLHSGSVSFAFIPHESSAYLDFWYPGTSSFEITLKSPGVNGPVRSVRAPSGNYAYLSTPDGKVIVDNASGGPNPNNNDKEILVKLDQLTDHEPWTITIKDNGGGGRLDGWVALSSMGQFPTGDSKMTISEPGNVYKIITVGAFTTKYEWEGSDGSPHHFTQASQIGEIAPFSSYGPTRDGREKPDIAAPGSAIASSLASGSDLSTVAELVLPDRVHAVLQGTSQAAPHVSGLCALMLEADPHLTLGEIKERLAYTAKSDKFTGTTPNNRWGTGKINASRGFNTIGLEELTSQSKPAVKVGPNPAETSAFFYYDLPPASNSARLVVFNVVGKQVFSHELDPGKNRYQWDLKSENGENLANGLYIFMLITDKGKSRIHRLVIRR